MSACEREGAGIRAVESTDSLPPLPPTALPRPPPSTKFKTRAMEQTTSSTSGTLFLGRGGSSEARALKDGGVKKGPRGQHQVRLSRRKHFGRHETHVKRRGANG